MLEERRYTHSARMPVVTGETALGKGACLSRRALEIHHPNRLRGGTSEPRWGAQVSTPGSISHARH